MERIKSIEKQKKRFEKKYESLIEQSKINLKTKDFSTLLFFNATFFLELKLDRIQEEEYNLQMLLLEKKNKINENFITFKKLSNEKI
ncbi:MAG: hypothetical protein PF503_05820, partial [Desulfobacula sp.]|nr:hypothetical protein [Desulfobacula sp.]